MNLSTQQALQHCTVCPRNCGADRLSGKVGFCGAGTLPKVALVSAHQWEEPPISGTRGSGTVFFSHCNLRCVFCQNHDISQENFGAEISIERLTEIFLEQQNRGPHNINLVSASHFIPQIAEALEKAKAQGLSIPVVYNSNGYESLDGLRMLDGLVDVYLPTSNTGMIHLLCSIPRHPITPKPQRQPFWKCADRRKQICLMKTASWKKG